MPATLPRYTTAGATNFNDPNFDWNSYLASMKGGASTGYIPPMPGEGGTPNSGIQVPTKPVMTAPTAPTAATPATGDWQTQFNDLMAQLAPEINAAENPAQDPTSAATAAAAGEQAYQSALIPGYAGLQEQSSANIGSELAGNVSQSTKNTMAQGAAERGVNTGTIYGQGTNAAYLSALGTTSEAQQAKGQSDLLASEKQNYIDPTTLVVTPQQRAQIAAQLTQTVAGLAGQLQNTELDNQAKSALQDKIDASNLQLQIMQMQQQIALQKLSDADKSALQDKMNAAQLQLATMEQNTKVALANQSQLNSLLEQQQQIAAQLQQTGMNNAARAQLQRQQNATQMKIAELRSQSSAMPNYQQPGYQPSVPGNVGTTPQQSSGDPGFDNQGNYTYADGTVLTVDGTIVNTDGTVQQSTANDPTDPTSPNYDPTQYYDPGYYDQGYYDDSGGY
jgi:hypothetical protein